MRFVEVKSPSFPEVPLNTFIYPKEKKEWQVLFGDFNHWRVELYSPLAHSENQTIIFMGAPGVELYFNLVRALGMVQLFWPSGPFRSIGHDRKDESPRESGIDHLIGFPDRRPSRLRGS